MEILELLQSIRNPVFNVLSGILTFFGSEVFILAVLFVVFWCVDKKFGYRLCFAYFLSGIVVQTIKIIARVPRPWVQNKAITPVKSAVKGATGYSFPSAHTQTATSFYGTFACVARKKWLRALFIVLIIAVGFSRMYLGVHTPADVSAAMLISLMITYFLNLGIDNRFFQKFRQEAILFAIITLILSVTALSVFLVQTGYVNGELSADQFKSLGAFLGFAIGWYVESTFVDFKTDNKSKGEKIGILVVGVLIALGLRIVLKILIGGTIIGDYIRYAILVVFAIAVYPWCFEKTLKKRNKKSNNQ